MKLVARILLLAVLLAGLIGLETHPSLAGGEPDGGGKADSTAQEGRTGPKATRDDDIERFEPSEEVPAASAVSFPVDI